MFASSIKKAASITGAFALVFQATAANSVDGAATAYKSQWNIGLPGSKADKQTEKVDACVADAWDTSVSVTDIRFRLEREAYAQALRSDDFGHALKMGRHKQIAMNVFFYDDFAKPVTNGWVVVNEKTRFALADKIEATPRNGKGYTRTGEAVEHALKELEKCSGAISVIDIVTDGKLNYHGCEPSYFNCLAGLPLAEMARNEAAARGVRINVLAVQIDDEPGLAEWAVKYMATQSPDMQEEAGVHLTFNQPSPPAGKVLSMDGMNYKDSALWVEKFKQMRVKKLIEEIAQGQPQLQPG